MDALGMNVSPFFAWLLRATLQGSVLVCLILLIKLVLRNRLPVRWHYVLWLVLLARLSLPWAPQSRLSVYNLFERPQRARPVRTVTRDAPVVASQSGQRGVPRASRMNSQPAGLEDGAREPSGVGEPPSPAPPAPVPAEPVPTQDGEARWRFADLRIVLPVLWLIGAVVLVGYVLARNVGLWRAVKRERPVTDQQILDALEDGKMQMGVQTIVGLVVTDRIKSPALFGFVRPRILLPEGLLEALSLDDLQYVFLHELAHLKRRDIYLGWLVSLLQILHWFNPLIWFAFRRMRTDQETACDALALSRMTPEEPPAYGRTIVNLLERFSQPHYVPSIAGILEEPSNIERRMTMIAKFKRNSYQWSPLAAILIVILACISLPDAKCTRASGIASPQSAAPIVLRRVWAGPDVDLEGAPSPDGKYLSYVDLETGDLAVYEIATGKKRRLTNKGSWGESSEFAECSRWSPDGRQIVYDWYNKDGFIELHIVGLDGSRPRILYRNEEVEWAQVYDWSPGGEQIVACLSRKGGPKQIVLVSVSDGSERILKTFDSKWPHRINFSPDARHIVYDLAPQKDSPDSDIFVLSIDGGHEIPLVRHPAHDFVLGWAPDGKNILFASDRTGTLGAWLIAVEDGKPRGESELIRPNIGRLGPLGFTKDGSFYYGITRGSDDVYVAALDEQTGKILTPQKKVIGRHEGSNVAAAYSADGKYLAYVYQLGFVAYNRSRQNILCIRSLETGKEREFPVNLDFVTRSSSPRWSPDGCSVIVTGLENNGYVARKVDIQSGEVKTVAQSHSCEWTHDGEAVLYIHRAAQAKKVKILLRDLETGIEDEVYQSSEEDSHPYNMSVSPDGRWLAVRCNRPTSLKIFPVAGGKPRELTEFESAASNHKPIAWSADSQYILFSGREPSRGKHPLCRISVESGKTEKLGLQMNRYYGLSAHPDGRRILISGRESALESEVWVMEDFLQGAPVAKPEPSVSLRRVKTGPMSDFSSPPSQDGRYLCDLGAPDAEGYRPLAVRDLVTGEVRPLTKASRSFPWCPVISPDSKHVAYVCQSWSPPKNELQLVGMDGTEHRVLYRLKEDEKFHIRAWTPDGKKVLGAFKKGSESLQLVAFAIEDGSMQVIYTFDTYWPMWQSALHKVAISPDGRYIAYDRPPEKGSWNAEIYILDIEHKRAECVVQHPAYDKLLGWTPDGNHIFFTSDRRQGLPGGFTATNTRDAYLLPVAGGKTQGPPVLIKSDIPDTLRPKGFTSSGSYHYTVEFKTIEAVVAELDLQTGRLLTKPQAVGQTGAGQIPAWSPDGRLLAYGIHKPDQSQTIRIQDIDTGGERELDPNLPHFSWLRWSPDGKSFLVSNFAKNSPRAIYRINADTGERLTMVQSESSDTLPGQPQLSADGSTLYYVLFHSDSNKASLLIRDIESGHEEELFALDGTRDIRGLNFALSPDGRQLALATEKMMTSAAGVDKRILIMPAKGGEPRELWKTEGRATRPAIAWTADGQALLFTKRIPEGGRELWLMPAGGGQARKLCSSQEMMCPGMMYGSMHSALDMHPDGQRIAFDCFEYRHEVWVMENFLPGAPAPVARPEREATTLRKLAYPWGGCAVLSPDGKYLCDVDWDVDWETETEKLVLRELATGRVRVLTTTGHPEYAAISPTSAQVAYLCHDANWAHPSLYTVGLDGSDRRCVRHDDCLVPKAWSADGSKILALECDKNPKQLVWVSVADGSLEHIVSVDKGYPQGEGHPGRFDVSPDGRFLAYARLQGEDAVKRDLAIFDLEENRETAVAPHPANDRLLGWTPDGKFIFFASDCTGAWDGWLQRVTDGVPQGYPELVRRNIGDVRPIGFGQGGSFYYHTGNKPMWDVFIAALDLDKGRVLAAPMPVHQTGTSHFTDWSPDGRQLAYCTGGPGEMKTIHIRDLATGEEREIDTGLPVFAYPHWSPDGRSILGATARERPHSIYRVDARTGERTELVRSATGPLWECELFPDGETLLYVRDDPNSRSRCCVVRNLATGHEEDLVRATRPVRLEDLALSPDGQRLVYVTSTRVPVRSQTLKIILAAGGEPRELLQFDESQKMWLGSVAWTPDSQDVLFVKRLTDDEGGELWRIPARGGEPRKVWAWNIPFSSLSVHPDGQRIAFHTSTTDTEMWVIENFLPKAVAAARE